MKDRFGLDWSKVPGSRFWRGPHLSRRVFFRNTAAAVGGFFLLPTGRVERVAYAAPPAKAAADNCIFVLMGGAPRHIDTFYLKVGPRTPPALHPSLYDGMA